MTIDPKTLPDGTVAEIRDSLAIETRYIYEGGTRISPASPSWGMNAREIIRVFVPVPDGVAFEDAEKALAALVPEDPDAELIDTIRTMLTLRTGYVNADNSLARDVVRVVRRESEDAR